jgi:hypothetical protein
MTQGKRDSLSAEQRTDMWRRWKAGESLHEIGRGFGKDHGSIQFLLSQRGGIVSSRSSALAANAHGGQAGRHLTRKCFRFVDSGDSQRVAAGCVDGEPGGSAPRRASTLSSQ